MTDVKKCLHELGITDWVLRGEPSSETEFNEMFRKITGADSEGNSVESDNYPLALASHGHKSLPS